MAPLMKLIGGSHVTTVTGIMRLDEVVEETDAKMGK